MTLRQRSSEPKDSVAEMFLADAHVLAWLSGTILGREVVPDV